MMLEAKFPEDPLPLLEINVDDTSHIALRDPQNCLLCANKPCTYICPGQVFEWEEEALKINYSRCVECGACQKICPENIIWEYPRAGYGITYHY